MNVSNSSFEALERRVVHTLRAPSAMLRNLRETWDSLMACVAPIRPSAPNGEFENDGEEFIGEGRDAFGRCRNDGRRQLLVVLSLEFQRGAQRWAGL